MGDCYSATWERNRMLTSVYDLVGICVTSGADEFGGRDQSEYMQVSVDGNTVVTVYNDVDYDECVAVDVDSGSTITLKVVASSSYIYAHSHMRLYALELVYEDWDHTDAPSSTPTTSSLPTPAPTMYPTPSPTQLPTLSDAPTTPPTVTSVPTKAPSDQPSAVPTALPTALPTAEPTPLPSSVPTVVENYKVNPPGNEATQEDFDTGKVIPHRIPPQMQQAAFALLKKKAQERAQEL
mmetsp:Transcript_36729/g.98526  ORF Transcript_36729/g.98526 Transcript_36729/m.98526 type:complete len:237 (+) Transcript_36729:637-1347(+)